MKNKVNTLVVGVDFSDYSKIVVREAKQLASALKLNIVYVYAYENANFYEELMTVDKAKVANLYEEKIRRFYGVDESEKITVRIGQPAKEILKVAKKEKNPMIIVGHKGGNALAEFFLGSVAEKLASTTTFPLWIHRGKKVMLPKRVLIPSDLSQRSDKTISELKHLKKNFDSQLEIYHVLEEPMPILDYASWTTVYNQMVMSDTKKLEAFRKKHPALKVTRAQGNIISSIKNYANKFDLIAISPHESPKDRKTFGRVSGKIVRSGDKPVLLLP